MLGKLNWSAIPLDQPIPMITSGVVVLAILGVLREPQTHQRLRAELGR
jgi:hypothetical protein